MFLCSITSTTDWDQFFGKINEPIQRTTEVIVIGQKPDCSSFLLLVAALDPLLTQHDTVPVGYDFTFRQEWGLTINDEIVHRTWAEIRRNAYPDFRLYLDAIVKNDSAQLQSYIALCLAVKKRFPKLHANP